MDDFLSYYKSFKGRYFLISCLLSYEDPECQLYCQYFVPTIRKGTILERDLSTYQRLIKRRLDLKNDENATINISDFSDQVQSINLDYLEVLVRLGLKVKSVYSVVTATKAPLFKPLAEKLFKLKSHAPSDYERGWMKLVGSE